MGPLFRRRPCLFCDLRPAQGRVGPKSIRNFVGQVADLPAQVGSLRHRGESLKSSS